VNDGFLARVQAIAVQLQRISVCPCADTHGHNRSCVESRQTQEVNDEHKNLRSINESRCGLLCFNPRILW
jgi:hypothetical protein